MLNGHKGLWLDIPSHVTILNQSEFSISTTTSAPGWNQSILNKQSWRSSFSRKRFWSQKRTFLFPLAMTAVCHIGHCLFSLLLDFQKFPIRFDILPPFFLSNYASHATEDRQWRQLWRRWWKSTTRASSKLTFQSYLVFIGDDSCLRGRGFESQRRVLDGLDIFSQWFVVKIVLFDWKDQKWMKKRPGLGH